MEKGEQNEMFGQIVGLWADISDERKLRMWRNDFTKQMQNAIIALFGIEGLPKELQDEQRQELANQCSTSALLLEGEPTEIPEVEPASFELPPDVVELLGTLGNYTVEEADLLRESNRLNREIVFYCVVIVACAYVVYLVLCL